jgi:hypothetical protein
VCYAFLYQISEKFEQHPVLIFETFQMQALVCYAFQIFEKFKQHLVSIPGKITHAVHFRKNQ